MSSLAFDTHEVVKELKAAGFSDDQAEAVTRVVRDATGVDLSGLATKSDLTSLATKSDLSSLATKADLASLATKADLTGLATKAELTSLATKADLAALAIKSEAVFATKADLQVGLAETKTEILKWMISSIGIQTVVIIGAVIALVRVH